MKIRVAKEEKTVTFHIEGRIDTETAPSLGKEINKVISKCEKLTLDLRKTEYITSAGLRVILAAFKEMKSRGDMKIINASPIIKEIFDMTGFSEIVDVD